MAASELRRWAGQNVWLTASRQRAMRMRARVARPGTTQRLFVNSLPKAGTHLLMQALDYFPGVRYSGLHLAPKRIVRGDPDMVESSADLDWDMVRNLLDGSAKDGQYVTAHLWGHDRLLELLDELDYASIFMIRDPRDIVISSAAYIARLRRHPHHRRFVRDYPDAVARFNAIINGYPSDPAGPGRLPLKERLEGFMPWLAAQGAISCRFEDLVGESGGGSVRTQTRAIMEIASHIGRPLALEDAEPIARRAWSPRSTTFRSGVIGEWRERFDQRTRDAFADAVGDDLMQAYGYEL